MKKIFIIIIINNFYLFAQTNTDKPVLTCNKERLVSRWLSTRSSITENQAKLDMTYYRINIDIDISNQEISGLVLINGTLDFEEPDSIELDLSNVLVVDSVMSNGQTINFVHENDIIKIPLEISMRDGYNFSLEVFYSGTPPSTGFGSFNFDEHQNIDHIWTLSEPYGARDWWPCKDDPSDKVDSLDIIITVPSDQIAVSNGLMISELDLGDGRTQYHWSERYPICTYLVSITTYPYTKWEDYYVGINGDTLPLEYYVYPDHYELVYDNYMLTNDMMEVFAARFGEYPFMGEKYGHVEFGRGGGMEHQTISSLGGYSQWLIAHELGHQWWGDLITCSSFHHIWLNEGFARFSEAIWDEAVGGFESYKDYWQNHSYYGSGTVYVEEPDTPSQIFNGNLTYNKAGWVVHMLRGVMGDSIFFETLKSYGANDSLKYASATTEDFQKVCEDVSGFDLENFFQQWIYGEFYPKYGLHWNMSDNNELLVTIEQNQNWQYFHMPIELRVFLPGDTLTFKVDNQGQIQHYNLGNLNGAPYAILLDPDNWILKEVEYMSAEEIFPSKPQITVYSAYPNPFNPETTIKFFVSEILGEINPSISIYDIKGHKLQVIELGTVRPGIHEFKWNAKNFGSGIYFIQFSYNNSFYSQKVQLLK